MTRGRRVVTLNLIWRRPTWIRSSVVTRAPTVAGVPFTFTFPALMISSIARREPRPACASTFCNFCERATTGAAGVAGTGIRFNLVPEFLREPRASAGVLLGECLGEGRRLAGSAE